MALSNDLNNERLVPLDVKPQKPREKRPFHEIMLLKCAEKGRNMQKKAVLKIQP
jgi:hypothetical protein